MTVKDISWKTLGVASVTLFVFSWFIWNHYQAAPNTTQGNWSNPPQAVSAPEVIKPGPKKVVTLDKATVSRKLDLPSSVTKDPSVDVLTTADITTKRSRIAAVAYMNMSTGRTTISAKEVPQAFLRFENTKEIGVRLGVNHKVETVADLHGRFQFLGLGPAKVGVYGEINGKVAPEVQIKEGRIMLDISGEF